MSRDAYFLPRHPSEADRLDIQHYALRATMGANFLAPVRQPARVLDVGCGTSLWAFEVAEMWAGALVVGFDMVRNDGIGPANYRFVQGNLLAGLPFRSGEFDFVHQRLLVSGIPVAQWPRIVEDLVRVTRRGGWVELLEAKMTMNEEVGPASARLTGMLHEFIGRPGLDTGATVVGSLEGYLRRAGAIDVRSRVLRLPIGEWGGEVGSWMATDIRSVYARMAGAFQARFGVSAEELGDLVTAMLAEFEQDRPTAEFKVAIGRRL